MLAMLFSMPAPWEKDFGANGSILMNLKALSDMTKSAPKPKPNPKEGIKNPPSSRLYLLGFIPLYKITYREQQTVFKLFNFLPLLTLKKV
jgi:hypothetical protein